MNNDSLEQEIRLLTHGAERLIFADAEPGRLRAHERTRVHRPTTRKNRPKKAKTRPAGRESRTPAVPLRQPSQFYHQPLRVAPHNLHKQHLQMLQAAQYDSFMDTSTSSRFGTLDTTLSMFRGSIRRAA